MSQCLINPLGGGVHKTLLEQVTASTSDVLNGKIIINSDGELATGTMPNNGTWNSSIGIGGSITIPKGYHSGSGKVTNDKSALNVITAGAGDVLSGKVIVDKNGNRVNGTMTNRGAWSYTLSAESSIAIPAGYHNGSGKVTGPYNASVVIPAGYHDGSGKVTMPYIPGEPAYSTDIFNIYIPGNANGGSYTYVCTQNPNGGYFRIRAMGGDRTDGNFGTNACDIGTSVSSAPTTMVIYTDDSNNTRVWGDLINAKKVTIYANNQWETWGITYIRNTATTCTFSVVSGQHRRSSGYIFSSKSDVDSLIDNHRTLMVIFSKRW